MRRLRLSRRAWFRLVGYGLGLYHTTVGPLYVGAGSGSFYLKVRFRCRPEITLVEL